MPLMLSRPSSIVLILANLVPLIGVLYFDWLVFDILLLYWAESVIIGLVNVLRMAVSKSDNILAGMLPLLAHKEIPVELQQRLPRIDISAFKYFLIPFFVLHYGGFCYGHLMAVIGLFSDAGLSGGISYSLVQSWQPAFWIAVLAIAASHLYSFASNFIGKGEYRNTSLIALMQRPYGRIVALHIAIVFGAGLVLWLDSPLPMLSILIAAKIVLDLRLHSLERSKLQPAGHRPKSAPVGAFDSAGH